MRHVSAVLFARHVAASAVVAFGGLAAMGAHAQTQGPTELIVPAAAAPATGGSVRPADPIFANPHKDPRDFEGLWWPRGTVQSQTPIPEGVITSPRQAAGTTPPSWMLSGPVVGLAATNEEAGSTLQCTPVWRLIGAGGGMSNYWIMGDREIVLFAEEDMEVARRIFMDATHPPGVEPQPNGHSIGHWEGDILVVDTSAFSKPDGALADRHVVERFRKQDGLLIDDAIVTQDGQTVYARLPSRWRPDFEISENVCEEGFRRYELRDGKVILLNTLPEG